MGRLLPILMISLLTTPLAAQTATEQLAPVIRGALTALVNDPRPSVREKAAMCIVESGMLDLLEPYPFESLYLTDCWLRSLQAYRGRLPEDASLQIYSDLENPLCPHESLLGILAKRKGFLQKYPKRFSPDLPFKQMKGSDFDWAREQHRLANHRDPALREIGAEIVVADQELFEDTLGEQVHDLLTDPSCEAGTDSVKLFHDLCKAPEVGALFMDEMIQYLEKRSDCSEAQLVYDIEAVRGLSQQGKALLPQLLKTAQVTPSPVVRRALLKTFTQIGMNSVLEVGIAGFLEEPTLREDTLLALQRSGMNIGASKKALPEWAPKVVALLEEVAPGENPTVELEAIGVLSRLGQGKPFLKRLEGLIDAKIALTSSLNESDFKALYYAGFFTQAPPTELARREIYTTALCRFGFDAPLDSFWQTCILLQVVESESSDPGIIWYAAEQFPALRNILHWIAAKRQVLATDEAHALLEDFKRLWLQSAAIATFGDQSMLPEALETAFVDLVLLHGSLWGRGDQPVLSSMLLRVNNERYRNEIGTILEGIVPEPAWIRQWKQLPLPLRLFLAVFVGWLPFWSLLWLVLLRIQPILPLKLFLWLDPKAKRSLGIYSRPLSSLILLPRFALHVRALDGWVSAHLPAARSNFERHETVCQRAIHLPVPHRLNGEMATLAAYRKVVSQKSFCLLISGQGGSGKTSLACWLAHHLLGQGPGKYKLNSPLWQEVGEPLAGFAMLPLLFETAFSGESLQSLLAERLRLLVDAPKRPPLILLQALLKHRRLLIITDHLSEQEEATREALASGVRELDLNALLVTSRKSTELGGYHPCHVVPQGLGGVALMQFTQGLLEHLATDPTEGELDETYLRVKELAGGYEVTPFVVRLAVKELGALRLEQSAHLSHSLPELINNYLTRIRKETPIDTDLVRAARYAAWACIKDHFRPGVGQVEHVGAWLSTDELTLLEPLVDMGLLRWTDENHQRFRFNLDPVSEYQAAYLLVVSDPERSPVWLAIRQRASVRHHTDGDAPFSRAQAWTALLWEIENKVQRHEDDQDEASTLEAIGGFLRALHHTVVVYGKAMHLPDDLADRLAGEKHRTAPKPNVVNSDTGLLVRLHHENPEERSHAATRLADLGAGDTRTATTLAEHLQSEEVPEVSKALVRALGRLGDINGLDALVASTHNKHAVVRLECARALVRWTDESKARNALLSLVGDKDEKVQKVAETLLQKTPLTVQELVAGLVSSRLEPSDAKRDWCLARISLEMLDVYPALLPYLEDEDDLVVTAAAEAFDRLVHVCSEPVGLVLVDALLANFNRSDKVIWTCIRALESVSVFGKNRNLARRSFGPLASLLSRNLGERVTSAASRALFTFFRQRDRPPALQMLLRWVGEETVAQEGLLRFVALAEKEGLHMVDDLEALLQNPVPTLRYRAALALAPFDEGKATLPFLAEALQDPSFDGRLDVIEKLGELGEKASSALWVLVGLASRADTSEELSKAARLAITKIKRQVNPQDF